MMTFHLNLDLPYLISDSILKDLELRDVLNLRRACMSTNSWVFQSLIQDAWKANLYFTVDPESGVTFDKFTSIPLKPASLHIINGKMDSPGSFVDVYSDPIPVSNFLASFGGYIRSIHVQVFNGCKTDAEFNFFSSLPALEELQIDTIDLKTGPYPFPLRFPPTFASLQVLKTDLILSPDPLMEDYHWKLMQEPLYTTTIRKPQNPGELVQSSGHPGDHMEFGYFLDVVTRREDSLGDLPLVTHIDLEHFYDPAFIYELEVTRFFKICFDKNIRVLNVIPKFVGTPEFGDQELRMDFARWTDKIVESVIGIGVIVDAAIAGIREIRIPSTAEFVDTESLELEEEWIHLKLLHVHFDTERSRGRDAKDVAEFLLYHPSDDNYGLEDDEILLSAPVRNSVRDLKISFGREANLPTAPSITNPSIIKPVALGEHFGRLKRLEIVSWDGKNLWWTQLWKSLQDAHLEEIVIDDCQTLGNVGFIEDPANPLFLKFRNLKKLKLKTLNAMPKVTDRVFIDVFAHMRLDELILTSSEPLEKVTPAAFQALAKGLLGMSVRKIPFDSFKMAGISGEDVRQLKEMFRCYQ